MKGEEGGPDLPQECTFPLSSFIFVYISFASIPSVVFGMEKGGLDNGDREP